jgi:hypothetical protein
MNTLILVGLLRVAHTDADEVKNRPLIALMEHVKGASVALRAALDQNGFRFFPVA